MGKPRKLASIFVAALFAALASDAFAQGIMERFRTMTEVYPPPELIAGDTAANGVLLIDAAMRRPAGSYVLDGAAIVEAAAPDHEILVGAFNVRGAFPPRGASMAVFANLAPGTYRIVRMRFWSVNENIWVTPSETDNLSIEVRAGEAAYLGRLVASQRMFSTQINYAVTADPEREAVAWGQVLSKFGETPWTPIIQTRLDALSNPSAEQPPPAPPPG